MALSIPRASVNHHICSRGAGSSLDGLERYIWLVLRCLLLLRVILWPLCWPVTHMVSCSRCLWDLTVLLEASPLKLGDVGRSNSSFVIGKVIINNFPTVMSLSSYQTLTSGCKSRWVNMSQSCIHNSGNMKNHPLTDPSRDKGNCLSNRVDEKIALPHWARNVMRFLHDILRHCSARSTGSIIRVLIQWNQFGYEYASQVCYVIKIIMLIKPPRYANHCCYL